MPWLISSSNKTLAYTRFEFTMCSEKSTPLRIWSNRHTTEFCWCERSKVWHWLQACLPKDFELSMSIEYTSAVFLRAYQSIFIKKCSYSKWATHSAFAIVHVHITAVAGGKDLWTQKPSSKSFYLPSPSSKYSLKETLSPNTQLADQKK